MRVPPLAPCAFVAFVLSFGATCVAHAQCLDGSAATACATVRAAFDPDVVAIAPFDVLMPSLNLWHEGMVDVLSRRLDGAGPLRTVSASSVIRGWTGRADPASARRLGQRTHAQFAVFGELVGAGTDSVRISASVMDVKSGRVAGTIEATNSSARMDLVADTLTFRLLAVLGRARGGVLSAVDFDTHSLPALKAYLEGEQLFRRARHDSAGVFYRRAIALDSGFMQARRRLSWAAQWRCEGAPDYSMLGDMLSRIAAERPLSTRDSVALQIDSLNTAIAFIATRGPASTFALETRLGVATARAVRLFPRDAEFWHLRGEALMSPVMPHTAATSALGLAAFESAVAEDPGLAPPYEDAAEVAASQGDYAKARRLMTAYVREAGGGECAVKGSLIADLLPGGLVGAARERRIHDAPASQLLSVLTVFRRIPDAAETAIALSRVDIERRLKPAGTDTARLPKGLLGATLNFRGRFGAADSASASAISAQTVRMFMGTVSPRVLALGADKLPVDEPHVRTLWRVEGYAHDRDTVALDQFAQTVDSLVRIAAVPGRAERYTGETETRRNVLAYAASLIRAGRLLATGDTATAVQVLVALPEGVCFGCVQHVPILARVYTATGRHDAAAPLYRRELPYVPDGRHVYWAFERAVALDKVHDNKGARENYQFVVNVWGRADAELQGYVTQSRAALKRLK